MTAQERGGDSKGTVTSEQVWKHEGSLWRCSPQVPLPSGRSAPRGACSSLKGASALNPSALFSRLLFVRDVNERVDVVQQPGGQEAVGVLCVPCCSGLSPGELSPARSRTSPREMPQNCEAWAGPGPPLPAAPRWCQRCSCSGW